MKSLLKGFIFIALVFWGTFSFAQTNTNIKTLEFKDVSPGVSGSLKVTTESIAEDKGVVAIYGKLESGFPPQPQSITFTLKNIDGKGSFKDFTISSKSLTPGNINIAFVDIPLDKSSATRTQATSDRFQITSAVDNGVDYFFPASNKTYLTFNKFTPLPPPSSGSNTNTGTTPDFQINTGPLIAQGNTATVKSIFVNKTTTLPKKDPKDQKELLQASVEFAVVTMLPDGYPLPAYINFVKKDVAGNAESVSTSWQKSEDPNLADINGLVPGVTKHTFTIKQGEVYTVDILISEKQNAAVDEGVMLGSFIINSDYIFNKPVVNVAPGLAPINSQSINSAWNSLTSTFQPGSIEFFKVGSTDISAQGSDNSYIFLSNIPGLANSTKDGYPAFDPTQSGAFSKYIGIIINMIYGIIALLAVINIMRYGFSLMLDSATPFKKAENKTMIFNSFIALAVALGTYLILNTINPNLTKFDVSLNKVTITGQTLSLDGLSTDGDLPENYEGSKGITCDRCFAYPADPKVCPVNTKRADHGGYKGLGPLGGNSVDMACPTGTRVQAVAPGIIFGTGEGCKDGDKKCNGGMGNYVIVKHDQGNGKPWYAIYMHLSKVDVKGGQSVDGRQQVGLTGNTGYSTGAHLHFETVNENLGVPGKQKYKNCVLGLTCGAY